MQGPSNFANRPPEVQALWPDPGGKGGKPRIFQVGRKKRRGKLIWKLQKEDPPQKRGKAEAYRVSWLGPGSIHGENPKEDLEGETKRPNPGYKKGGVDPTGGKGFSMTRGNHHKEPRGKSPRWFGEKGRGPVSVRGNPRGEGRRLPPKKEKAGRYFFGAFAGT